MLKSFSVQANMLTSSQKYQRGTYWCRVKTFIPTAKKPEALLLQRQNQSHRSWSKAKVLEHQWAPKFPGGLSNTQTSEPHLLLFRCRRSGMGLRIFLKSSGMMLQLLLWGTHSYGIDLPPHILALSHRPWITTTPPAPAQVLSAGWHSTSCWLFSFLVLLSASPVLLGILQTERRPCCKVTKSLCFDMLGWCKTNCIFCNYF